MAPKAAVKRPAATTAAVEGPRKKRGQAPTPEQAEVAERLALIEEALRAADRCPQDARNMLASALRSALGIPKADRHPYQEKIVEFIGEVLSEQDKSIQEAITAAQGKVDGADAEKAARADVQAQAEAVLEERKATANEKQAAFDAASKAFSEAGSAMKAAEAAQRSGNHELDVAASKKEALEKVRQEAYVPLKEASITGAEAKKKLTVLSHAGKKYGFEPSLLTALVGALTKAPADRGEFDTVVLAQIDEEFATRISAIDKQQEEGQGGRAERAATVEAAKAVYEGGKAAQEDSALALEAAKDAQDKSEAAVASAREAVAAFIPECKRNISELEDAKASLRAFLEGPLAAFAALREPPQAPAPMDEGAAEAGAPAATPEKAAGDSAVA